MLTVIGGCLIGGAIKGWVSNVLHKPEVAAAISLLKHYIH